MSDLEAFDKIIELCNLYHSWMAKENIDIETVDNYPIENIRKSLQALEIIQKNGLTKLHMSVILSCKDYEEYSWEFDYNKKKQFGLQEDIKMTRKEFMLLKEVLHRRLEEALEKEAKVRKALYGN